MNQLTQYIIALSNLYGMVHKDKVVEIYNNQNKDQIILAQVEMLIKIPSEALEDYFIEVYNDHFVHEVIMDNGEFDLILRQKGAKPYYVPKKNELLKYVDEDYFEKTKPYNALLKYVKKNFFEGDEEKAEELCEDIQEFVQFGLDIQTILDFVTNQIENFNNVNQVNDIMQLVMELSNHTRIWENNGHTPYEIYEKFEKQNLRPLPDKQFDYNQTNVIDMKTKEKIGRNHPCPCGSGKKFKKCCL